MVAGNWIFAGFGKKTAFTKGILPGEMRFLLDCVYSFHGLTVC